MKRSPARCHAEFVRSHVSAVWVRKGVWLSWQTLHLWQGCPAQRWEEQCLPAMAASRQELPMQSPQTLLSVFESPSANTRRSCIQAWEDMQVLSVESWCTQRLLGPMTLLCSYPYNFIRIYYAATINWFAWVGHLRTISSLRQQTCCTLAQR